MPPCLSISEDRREGTPPLPHDASQLWTLVRQALPAAELQRAALQLLASAWKWPLAQMERSFGQWSGDERERVHAQLVIDDVTAIAWKVLGGENDDPPHLAQDPGRYYRALESLLGALPSMRIAVLGVDVDALAISQVVQLAEAVPGWHWTLEVDAHLMEWIATPPATHTKDVLRLSLGAHRSLHGTSSALTESDDAAASGESSADTQWPSGIHDDDAIRRSLEAAQRALDALPSARAGKDAAWDAAAARARSLAELALFRLLESLPETRGLFTLNQPMPFNFGLRPAELDLYCTKLRLCIEVDGPHHFANAEAYRRDRRKDALLQEHGIWVRRVLAEDIARRTEEVLRHILNGVRKRRGEESRT